MSELYLHKFAPERVSIVYGEKNIIPNFPIDESDDEVWNRRIFSTVERPPVSKTRYFSTAESQEAIEALILPWSEKEDTFTQTDLLDSEEKEVQELIFRIRTSRTITHGEGLANRLLTLNNDAKEEDLASIGIALDSLHNFYNFLQLHSNLKCPIISLTPDNNIYVSWKEEQNRLFSVHFLSNGDVRFVIFKPNDKHLGLQIRISGTATTDTLIETIASSGVRDWISE